MSSDRDENGAGRTSPDVERSATEPEGTGEFTTSPAPTAWYTQGVPPPSTSHDEEAGTGSSHSGSAMPPLPNGFTAAHAPAPG
ncbi:SCO5717 family growth-regulating ATPase, partial [Streptomyces phytophilus]|uniref:SCO5717 family growth-regulating ATPase n=1 Tax=Streptomyces phytophilus TaxID=722715 RepID=UPI0015F08A24